MNRKKNRSYFWPFLKILLFGRVYNNFCIKETFFYTNIVNHHNGGAGRRVARLHIFSFKKLPGQRVRTRNSACVHPFSVHPYVFKIVVHPSLMSNLVNPHLMSNRVHP